MLSRLAISGHRQWRIPADGVCTEAAPGFGCCAVPGIESGRGNRVDGSAVRLAARRQPRPWLGDQSWNRPIAPSPRTCSSTTNLPPGTSTRRISPRVAATSVDRAQHQSDVYRVETVVRERNRLAGRHRRCRRRCRGDGQRETPSAGTRPPAPRRRPTSPRAARTSSRFPGRDPPSAAGRSRCHRRSAISAIEQPVEERLAEPIHVREQRITARYLLPRSMRNGGYSSRINDTYTATR